MKEDCNHQEDDKGRCGTSPGLSPRVARQKDILTSYFQEQENREGRIVAESDGFVAGYITILPVAKHGPFHGVYPELSSLC